MMAEFFRKLTVSFSTAIFGAGFLIMLMAAAATAQSTDNVEVTVDRAKVMRVNAPAATIIIGNPGIADATVQDPTTLVITGRSFGVTNMIILDEDGEVIVDTLLTVRNAPINALTVFRRTQRETFSCSPNCERSLTLGDADESFGRVQGQIQQRNSFATGQ